MFIQVASGDVAEHSVLRQQLERWVVEVRPGAAGFLGATAGITSRGHFVSVARFDGKPAARSNLERPEHVQWWKRTERCFNGPVEVRESEDLDFLGNGGSDSAGFVQVIEGRTGDRARFMVLEREIERGFVKERPDFIGSMLVWWESGAWLEVAYFSSEEQTRAAEQSGLSEGLTNVFSEWQGLAAPSSYHDFTQPLFLN
ncbi:MAG: hypothetical protein M3N98_12730 [Actinomycetota bacterium]|nr:hypothetical protein [Actinomycetota bacterium]